MNPCTNERICLLEEKILAFRLRWYGLSDYRALLMLQDLALSHRAMDDVRGAIELQSAAVDAYRRKLGPRDNLTIGAMFQLASFNGIDGNFPLAISQARYVLEARRIMYGDRHPETILVKAFLGAALSRTGAHEEALILQSSVLDDYQSLFGEGAQEVLEAQARLEETRQAQQSHVGGGSESVSDRGDGAMTGGTGPHPGDSDFLIGDASILKTIQLRAAGSDSYGAALTSTYESEVELLECRRKILGPAHPRSVRLMLEIADTLTELGQTAKALTFCEEALAEREERYGKADPRTREAAERTADALQREGEYSRAIEVRRRLAISQETTGGIPQGEKFNSERQLAELLACTGEYDEARTILIGLVFDPSKWSGVSHHSNLLAKLSLARVYAATGQLQRAESLDRSVIAESGSEPDIHVDAMGHLALLSLSQGDTANAEKLQRTVFDELLETLGETHPRTINAAIELTLTYMVRGDLDAAARMIVPARQQAQESLGDMVAPTLMADAVYASLLMELGDRESAEDLARSTIERGGRVASGAGLKAVSLARGILTS